MRLKAADALTAANSRYYAYTSGGLLLGEYTLSGSTPAWKRDVVHLGSEPIAEIDASGVHELHKDHLGSPRIVTRGSDGAIEARQAYAGYGEKILTDGTYLPLTGYTGHIQQDPTGLIYMRGRFYSPAWHNFVNSDQGVDPLSMNQTAYVAGRPFIATDPSGMRNSQPGARNSWAADWNRIFGFWLSDSYGINSAVVEVTDASPFPDYFDVGYSPPFGWGYDGALFEAGGVASVKQPQTPQQRNCEGLATIIGGNKNFIGTATGAFGTTITADSAAIIPSQFGFDSKDAMAPYVSQISGQIWNYAQGGWDPLFSDVRDRADDAASRRRHGWRLRQFESYEINKVSRLNGGYPALYIEVPGMSQINTAWVKITVPASMPCPQGTKEK